MHPAERNTGTSVNSLPWRVCLVNTCGATLGPSAC